MQNYDVGIIGAGVAGAFAALKIAESHKNLKTILFELGHKPAKRRRQLEGWFGCFPTGDGKLFQGDLDKVLDIANNRSAKAAHKWVSKKLEEVNTSKIIKYKPPTDATTKEIDKLGFKIEPLDFQQWTPDSIHTLSKNIADKLEETKNITFEFDNEVYSLYKRGNDFIISTSNGDFKCKKVILCAGRSGWRWVNKLYRDLGILVSDDVAKFGIRIEISAQYMKQFNKSHFALHRDDLVVGPFLWGGSVIQEDHADLTICAFRSNEGRWKSDKVFFSIIKKEKLIDQGTKQTDRIGKLAFLLSGDRVGREKVKTLIRGESQISLLPEFSWINNTLNELSPVIPAIVSRGYFHCPDIISQTSNINIGNNLETEVDGLFVAGESAGISGILAAAIMGSIAGENISK